MLLNISIMLSHIVHGFMEFSFYSISLLEYYYLLILSSKILLYTFNRIAVGHYCHNRLHGSHVVKIYAIFDKEELFYITMIPLCLTLVGIMTTISYDY